MTSTKAHDWASPKDELIVSDLEQVLPFSFMTSCNFACAKTGTAG
ncbi:hypothetical protein [Mariniblastus fucicola]|nr:hypothetical protein [Mariniblastus fucicola]